MEPEQNAGLFYRTFPIWAAVRTEMSRTHLTDIIKSHVFPVHNGYLGGRAGFAVFTNTAFYSA